MQGRFKQLSRIGMFERNASLISLSQAELRSETELVLQTA
jgi:hypothetical protein